MGDGPSKHISFGQGLVVTCEMRIVALRFEGKEAYLVSVGMAFKKIAEDTGTTVDAVKRRLREAARHYVSVKFNIPEARLLSLAKHDQAGTIMITTKNEWET